MSQKSYVKSVAKVRHEDLREIGQAALVAAGVDSYDAETVADVLILSDLFGVPSHGVVRLIPYIARISDGVINAKPNLSFERRGSTGVVFGDDGLGPVVASAALDHAIEIASESGVGYVACRDSQHCGALAPYAMRAAQQGYVVLLGSTAFRTMPPTGGRAAMLGNNPIAFGAPRKGDFPFILDMALSIAARGKLREAERKKVSVPEGWALDRLGNPTTDASEALRGLVLPVGAHKGYGLALVVDILSALLVGGLPSYETRSLFQQSTLPQKVGHFFIVLNPEFFVGRDRLAGAIEELAETLRGTEPIDPERPVILPGEIEAASYRERVSGGIPLDETVLASLRALANGESVTDVPVA